MVCWFQGEEAARLAQARVATNSLTALLAAARQLASDAEAIRTNETGRQVALHADLVAQARHLYDVELPALTPLAELTTKLESIRRIQQTVLENLGKAYEPEAEFSVTAQNAALWAEPEQRKFAQAQSAVAALGREAAIKVTSATVTAESPTLAAAIRQLTEAEAKERQRLLASQTAAANTNAMLMEAQAQVQRILQQALAQSNQVFLELQAQAAVQQASNQVAQAATEAAVKAAEERARQIQQEAVAQSNMMYAAFQDQLAAQRREAELRLATNQIENAKTTVAIQTAEEDARKVELRKKASEPSVQAKLAPFIQKGYWQIGGYSTEMKPLSFTTLQSIGALDDSIKGLAALAKIAVSMDDRVRPRWKLAGGTVYFQKYPASIEKLKEAQNLLIELGPVLVEMGKLQP